MKQIVVKILAAALVVFWVSFMVLVFASTFGGTYGR